MSDVVSEEVTYPAISLWQPWATLLATGAKRIETRAWVPRWAAGTRIAIHAAKKWEREQRELCNFDPRFREALLAGAARGIWHYDDPPRGAVVGFATFTRAIGCEELASRITEEERAFGNYASRRYGWILEDAQAIAPIPYRGQQGLFTVTLDPKQIQYR